MEVETDISDEVLISGTLTTLRLTVDGKLLWWEGRQKRCLLMKKDVIGFTTVDTKIRVNAAFEMESGSCSNGSSRTLARRHFDFQLPSQDLMDRWCRKLREQIDSLGRPKRLFILVNPFGGRRIAPKTFTETVKPLFDDANIEFTVRETKYQLHAKELVSLLDLTQYDGIVCVSGDGILVEVINGLLQRQDWKTAIKTPIGIVPGGTGNGMIKSLLDSGEQTYSSFNAALSIIRGGKRSVDVVTLSQGAVRYFSVLMVSWGLVADIDIESEKYRWMGLHRMDIYGFQRILSLRKYEGRICFSPAPGFEGIGLETSTSTFSSIAPPEGDRGLPYRGPKVELESLRWKVINGPFITVWLSNVPWGDEHALCAPSAEFSDGYMDLVVVRECPRLTLLRLLAGMGSGNHVRSPYVTYLKVKAFVLEPGARVGDPSKEGIVDCDGEVVARGRGTYEFEKKGVMSYDLIQGTIDQGLATLFSPV